MHPANTTDLPLSLPYHLLCVSFQSAFYLLLLSLHDNATPDTLSVFLSQLILDFLLTILHISTKHSLEPTGHYPAFSFRSLSSRDSELALFN